MKTTTCVELMRIVRYGLVPIFIFMGIAVFSTPLRAAEKTDVKAAAATDTVATATGSAETGDLGKKIEDAYIACMKADLTEKDMPVIMEYYSQYSDDVKAAVVQTGQCLGMMAEDDAACGLFKDMKPGTAYKVITAPPGATSTIMIKPPTGTEFNKTITFPADVEGCLDLRSNAAMMRKAVASPKDCARELLGYCNRDLAKLVDPKDKMFTCDRFAEFTCGQFDIDDVGGCDNLYKELGEASVVNKFCHDVLNGAVQGMSSWMRIFWLGGALKDKKWPILSSDFITDSIQLDPAYVVYAGAVNKRNDCFLPISPTLKSDVCTGVAKFKAGIPVPDKTPPPAGGTP